MTPTAKSPYAGHRFPPEFIGHAIWLYFRFPLSLRMAEEMLAARGILVSPEIVRQRARKFGQAFTYQIRPRLPSASDKWHLDEVVIIIAGKKHWLWRAVDQDGFVLEVRVQSRRDQRAAKRLLRKLLKKQGRPSRVIVTDKLASYPAAKDEMMPSVGSEKRPCFIRSRASIADICQGRISRPSVCVPRSRSNDAGDVTHGQSAAQPAHDSVYRRDAGGGQFRSM